MPAMPADASADAEIADDLGNEFRSFLTREKDNHIPSKGSIFARAQSVLRSEASDQGSVEKEGFVCG